MSNAKKLQDDINRSKNLANDILRQSEEPLVSGETIQEAEEKFDFLQREIRYSQRVQAALRGINEVNQILDKVEQAREERRILDALRLLEKSWTALDAIPAGKSVRAIKLLDIRAFELKSDVHEVFDHIWRTLVNVDVEAQTISITESRENEAMSMSDAVIGLQAYKEVDQRMSQLWHDIDNAIVGPRTDIRSASIPNVVTEGDLLKAEGQADKTIESLFTDLDRTFSYFAERLPPDLIESMSALMMPEVISRIITVWLDSSVPASLKDMDRFEEIMAVAKKFCTRLSELKYAGFNELQDWVEGAPVVWLAKCRGAALDTIRTRLAEGLGAPTQVERIEKQMVSQSEGKELAAGAGATAAADADDDWGAAWDDGFEEHTEGPKKNAEKSTEGDEEDGADAWGWGEEGDAQEATETKSEGPEESEETDPADAWGWGDEGTNDEMGHEAPARPAAASISAGAQTRELTLKETYNISSMPEPVLQLIFAILEDGALLTKEGCVPETHQANALGTNLYSNESSPVAKAASGLFTLPTLALAMFRAVSPHYYSLDLGGNMFLYNDAIYLAERLAEFATAWKQRKDLSTRAQNMLRLDNDVKTLRSFSTRAYSNEMSIQKTVLRDLLGGK